MTIRVPGPVETDPARLTWGIATTVKAPLRQIAGFLAWHLDLGVHQIHVHLDQPDREIATRLAHPRVYFIQCDDAYWARRPNQNRETHQSRQMFNATRTYRTSRFHWLAHIDVDEFILLPPGKTVPDLLAAAAPQAAFVALKPLEMMTCPEDPRHFKRYAPKSLRRQLYPTYGTYLGGGFLSTKSPKMIVRTGLQNIWFGIHAIRRDGEIVRNGVRVPDFELGHAHAPDFGTFLRHLDYRLEKGSYHDRKGKPNKIGTLIRALRDDPSALAEMHEEVCAPTPGRLKLLRAHDMVRSEDLALEARIAHHFGEL